MGRTLKRKQEETFSVIIHKSIVTAQLKSSATDLSQKNSHMHTLLCMPQYHPGLAYNVGGHQLRVSIPLLALFTLFSSLLTSISKASLHDVMMGWKQGRLVESDEPGLKTSSIMYNVISGKLLSSGASVSSSVKWGHSSFFLGLLWGLDAVAPQMAGKAQRRLFIFSTPTCPSWRSSLTLLILTFTLQSKERGSKQSRRSKPDTWVKGGIK